MRANDCVCLGHTLRCLVRHALLNKSWMKGFSSSINNMCMRGRFASGSCSPLFLSLADEEQRAKTTSKRAYSVFGKAGSMTKGATTNIDNNNIIYVEVALHIILAFYKRLATDRRTRCGGVAWVLRFCGSVVVLKLSPSRRARVRGFSCKHNTEICNVTCASRLTGALSIVGEVQAEKQHVCLGKGNT